MKTKFMPVIASTIISSLMFPAFQSAFADDTTAKIDYTINVGKQKHLVHLTICAGNEDVSSLNVIVHSWQDSKEISLKKIFPANTCKSFEVILEAKHANRIGVMVA